MSSKLTKNCRHSAVDCDHLGENATVVGNNVIAVVLRDEEVMGPSGLCHSLDLPTPGLSGRTLYGVYDE